MSKLAAGLSAAGSGLATLVSGVSQAVQSKKQRAHDIFMQDRTQLYNFRNWNLQNQYNSPAMQMQRLREAGLNPNLMYGSPQSGGNADNMHNASASASNTMRPIDVSGISQAGNSIAMMYDLRQKEAQTNLLQQQAQTQQSMTALNAVTAELKRLESIEKHGDIRFQRESFNTRVKTLEAQKDAILASIVESGTRSNLNIANERQAYSQSNAIVDENVRKWQTHPINMKQLIATYNQSIAQTNNIKANTNLTKLQTLSEQQKVALLEIESQMAKEGLSKDDSGIDRLIKSVLNNLDIFSTTWKPDTQIGRIALSIIKSLGRKKTSPANVTIHHNHHPR